MSRAALLSRFVPDPVAYRRIDRKEARLLLKVEFDEWVTSLGGPASVDYVNATPPATLVWAVAVAGDMEPNVSRGQRALWEVSSWNAETGSFVRHYWSSRNGMWPARWDNLPDRDPSRR